uniref:Uncharacterized protein n=1 Tax=Osugoroshi virus TaxID=2202814 RepID=A0A7R7T202_9VIRU|nr:hypothetical protein [Osugoroshi virus]
MEVERVIDLLGLEYPADIKATYNDLPTNIEELTLLREHLYYLYTHGTQVGDDDITEYALFANLHVRYRIMQFLRDAWDESDYTYFRIYEQKLPLMKWHPGGDNKFPEVSQDVVPNEVKSSDSHNEAPLPSSTIASEDDHAIILSSDDKIVKPKRRRRHRRKKIIIEDHPSIKPAKVKILAPNHRFDRAYLEYHTRIGSDVVFRIVTGNRIYCHRMTLATMAEFNIFAVSRYGNPIRYDCCDAKYLASLYFNVTGRFCGYDDAGIYISAVKRPKPRSLFSTALRILSVKWLSIPPSI